MKLFEVRNFNTGELVIPDGVWMIDDEGFLYDVEKDDFYQQNATLVNNDCLEINFLIEHRQSSNGSKVV